MNKVYVVLYEKDYGTEIVKIFHSIDNANLFADGLRYNIEYDYEVNVIEFDVV